MTVPLGERLFTLEEIRAAFWKTFRGAGEVWFSYFDAAEADQGTEAEWESFTEYLEKPWLQVDRVADEVKREAEWQAECDRKVEKP